MWLDQVEGKDWDFGKSGCVKTLSSCREFDIEIPPWLSSLEAGVEGSINWKEISVHDVTESRVSYFAFIRSF